jgi:hypothetical protein
MKIQRMLRWTVLAAGIILLTCLSGTATADPAPNLRAAPAAATRLPRQTAVARPQALDAAARLALASKLASVKVNGFGDTIKLSMRNGFVPNQGKLWLTGDVFGVDFEQDVAYIAAFKGLANPMNVDFNPSAKGKYLVDVTVSSTSPPSVVTYKAHIASTYGSYFQDISTSLPDTNGHLTFIYEVKELQWHSIELHADQNWKFYSCEITLMK